MFGFLRNNHPVVLLLMPVLAVLMWFDKLQTFHAPSLYAFDYCEMPLYRLVEFSDYYGSYISTLILLLIQALLLIPFNNRFRLIEERTFLP